MEGWKLSWSRHCSRSMKFMPKAMYRSSFLVKHSQHCLIQQYLLHCSQVCYHWTNQESWIWNVSKVDNRDVSVYEWCEQDRIQVFLPGWLLINPAITAVYSCIAFAIGLQNQKVLGIQHVLLCCNNMLLHLIKMLFCIIYDSQTLGKNWYCWPAMMSGLTVRSCHAGVCSTAAVVSCCCKRTVNCCCFNCKVFRINCVFVVH